MTFDEWLWEMEGFSSRHERAIEDMQVDPTNVSMWLEAAYEAGWQDGRVFGFEKDVEEAMKNETTIYQSDMYSRSQVTATVDDEDVVTIYDGSFLDADWGFTLVTLYKEEAIEAAKRILEHFGENK